jgi:hypothetical protein
MTDEEEKPQPVCARNQYHLQLALCELVINTAKTVTYREASDLAAC